MSDSHSARLSNVLEWDGDNEEAHHLTSFIDHIVDLLRPYRHTAHYG